MHGFGRKADECEMKKFVSVAMLDRGIARNRLLTFLQCDFSYLD